MASLSSYELRLEEFSGPLDTLLDLIEAQKLDISRFSLAQVTDDFLRYVEKLEDVPPALLADFIIIGSQLILLKSKSLLPDLSLTPEEEGNLEELEERLKAYREFKETGKLVSKLWREAEREASRPYFLSISRNLPKDDDRPLFYPGNTLTREGLLQSISRLSQFLAKTVIEEETLRETVVTLEEKMRHILGNLRHIEKMNFSDLSSSHTRAEMIVAFLAILHLAREQAVFIEQSDHFSDIIIMHNSDHS